MSVDASLRAATASIFAQISQTQHAVTMRSDFDKGVYVLVTAVTNCACIPAMVILWRRRFLFEFFVSVFTILTSFMYHFCDSIKGSAWLEEHKWHRLDNVFSIQAFATLFIYLSVLPSLRLHLMVNFFTLGFVMLMQEKSPWDVFYTIVPIFLTILLFLSTVVARCVLRRWCLFYFSSPLKPSAWFIFSLSPTTPLMQRVCNCFLSFFSTASCARAIPMRPHGCACSPSTMRPR